MIPNSTRLEHHDWHQIRQMAEANMVVLIPTATVEQHGPHLPCDVDNLIVKYYCDEAARRQPDLCTVAPLIPFGYNEHNMGFPGCITIGEHTLIELYTDVAMSFVRMGFRKIVFLNGHGSNPPFLKIACRKVVNQSEAHVSTIDHWDLIKEEIQQHRESENPGGMAHAGELETSLYLHICPERVKMDKAVKDVQPRWSKHVWFDIGGGFGPATMIDDWSRVNETGIEGDPMTSSAKKGKLWAEATITKLIEFLSDFRDYPVKPRRDYNYQPSDPGGEKA